MPNRRDNLPGPHFPSELNPLTNPTLEQNLGRWARVYFGTPLAQRPQAVGRLLQEIQRETAADPADQAVRPYFARDAKFQGVVCPACRHQNPPGHKFCSRCGQALNPAQSTTTDNLSATGVSKAPPPRQFENDVQWMRDQTFSGLEGSHTPHRQGWKYLAGAFVLVLAGFAYLQWAPRPQTGAKSSPVSPQASAPAATLPQNSSPAEANSPETISPESKAPEARDTATAEPHDRPAVPAGVQPASQKSPLLNAQPSQAALAAEEGGAFDLRLARRYLAGGTGVRDSSEAAKLLWKAVGKQNATAAVLLSDLYLRGDGVPRSCDQARLLLTAASRRGDPQAVQHLRNLASQGCR